MKIEKLAISEVLLITPPRFQDNRGFFSETYNAQRLKEVGIDLPFVQDNQSLSVQKGVVRGLHCQLGPYEQGKLVRCTQGSIWDVAIDARTGSPTYGKWVAAELSADNWSQLWIPPGFLHGFCTLTENVMVQYKCTNLYNKASERAVLWNCKEIGIEWPIAVNDAILSEKDMQNPSFSAAKNWFSYS
ncbi:MULTISPECIES: dTDP-4-dehydrorhamnose 3,5-epimerase [Commensalibacter]|uniref:dTDP-4-dehydrorhamnose 3,5-epimerase n=1 Tax=Commensalibacter TaxID=1079922 RepID=UPI0012D9B717|nr:MULTISPECIES: dTDP-4-dehydrorhamnose 3,5-epimerase [Commensalibacter]MUG09939.1 dTDP-4-dehydrorhamnose 3,5-epimerase [Commensalibacter melissae]MUG35253.1 dTDP-4-dehydrorhamnose 3,5-epimerase [Commensalibacter sp. ESL0382]MUH07084.1 dTDP-4-dehydrorhamnose 3,5-epimerase [Commensalibacter melissae]